MEEEGWQKKIYSRPSFQSTFRNLKKKKHINLLPCFKGPEGKIMRALKGMCG